MVRRRLTPDQRDRFAEQEQDRYEELYAEIEEAEREEYDRAFGAEYRALHPFQPDRGRVHAKVVARMKEEAEE